MPARIDHPAVREQVRALYYSNGRNLTLAAQTAGVPVDRAEKWKERGHWDAKRDALAVQSNVSETVGKTADHAALAVSEHDTPTRAALARAHRKAAEHAATLKAEKLMERDTAQALRLHGQGAGLVHRWEADDLDRAQVAVNIAILNA